VCLNSKYIILATVHVTQRFSSRIMKKCISRKAEQRRTLCFLLVRDLIAVLLVAAMGDDDHHNGFLEVPVYFIEWAKAEVYDQDQEHLTNWNKTFEIYCRSSVLRKMC